MDTSHRNNVSLCEDDDDIWYWGYSIFVPHIPNTRAYPYVSRITGPDPKYHFARKFLQHQWPSKTPKGRRFDVELPGDGVYEVGIKRWNADKTLLLERQVYWLLLLDGNEYHPQVAGAAAGGDTTQRHARCLNNKENPCEVNPHRGIFLMAQ